MHLRWVSWWARRLLVVAGARCPLTKPAVAAVEQQATTEPHCSRGVQPGGIYVYVGTAREPTPGGPGSGLRPGRRRFLCQLPLWFYLYIYICDSAFIHVIRAPPICGLGSTCEHLAPCAAVRRVIAQVFIPHRDMTAVQLLDGQQLIRRHCNDRSEMRRLA
jgi:hypothetical protein